MFYSNTRTTGLKIWKGEVIHTPRPCFFISDQAKHKSHSTNFNITDGGKNIRATLNILEAKKQLAGI
jgi:hypothetical protein